MTELSHNDARADASKPSGDKPNRRKRKFPYRKVPDLEAEIADCERRISELNASMALPEVFRDGDRVKRTLVELEEGKQRLSQLYEHWEEAVELN